MISAIIFLIRMNITEKEALWYHKAMSKAFLHIDLDAFFASVEILDNPDYAGRPLIIGHEGPRSVVSTCSYEARRYGVHSAMPMTTALKLCPDATVVHPRGKRYHEKSVEVMDIIRSFAPGFLQVSVDEAFLDISGMENIYGLPGKAARKLKHEILEKTGLTVSIGVASSRFLAKLASDYHKPDGLTIVPPSREIEFIDTVGLKKLWGIGDKTYTRLVRKGITSTRQLRAVPKEKLREAFGAGLSEYLYAVSRAQDPGIYQGEAKSHSISTESTYYPDVYSLDALEDFLFAMAQELSFRALEEKVVPRTVGIKLRYGDFSTYTFQSTPEEAIYSSNDIFNIARNLLRQKYNNEGVRLLGLVLSSVYDGEDVEQPELFAEKKEKERRLEKAVLELNRKGSRLMKARSLEDAEIKNDKC